MRLPPSSSRFGWAAGRAESTLRQGKSSAAKPIFESLSPFLAGNVDSRKNQRVFAEHSAQLRVSPPVYQGRKNIIPDGTIAFDYGAKTYRFAQAVDEAEARQLVETVVKRYAIPVAGDTTTSKPSW